MNLRQGRGKTTVVSAIALGALPEDVWLQFCFICCGTGEQAMDANEPCVVCDGSGFLPHECGE